MEARFVTSAPSLKLCPETTVPEFAFIGRSNVGKSSLINMLTGRKNLARTSSTPGKTQLINFFLIDDSWHLVDLPGYGYAKVSKKTRLTWEKMIRSYLSGRKQLRITFLLVDSRHEPLEADKELVFWFGQNELPFVIAFTKSDKPSQKVLNRNIRAWVNFLEQYFEELPPAIITSAEKGKGRDELLQIIQAAIGDA
ncbi:MAG: ribosome biogenesis GTP-binding protein YihA/YsxC [Bacteroidales bacterium]